MSIALSTIVLFFFLVPGIVFRRFYYSEEFSREYFKESFFGVFIATILPSLLFQILWYFLVIPLGYSVDLYVVGDLVSQNPSRGSIENVDLNSINILLYNLSLFLAAGASGYIFKKIVRVYKWDRRLKFFRFQNAWHYILKGEFFDFPRTEIILQNDTVEDIEFVFIDAVMEISNDPYLYEGILVDYELSGNGGLETISISNTRRRKLCDENTIKDDDKDLSNYYPIKGHILVLKYLEVKNLNFTYFTLDSDDDKITLRMVE